MRYDAIRNISASVFISGKLEDSTLGKINNIFNFSIGLFSPPAVIVAKGIVEKMYDEKLAAIELKGEVMVDPGSWARSEPARRSDVQLMTTEKVKCPPQLFQWADRKWRSEVESER